MLNCGGGGGGMGEVVGDGGEVGIGVGDVAVVGIPILLIEFHFMKKPALLPLYHPMGVK